MEKDIKSKQKKIVKRSYLARDFDGFKQNLIQFRINFYTFFLIKELDFYSNRVAM